MGHWMRHQSFFKKISYCVQSPLTGFRLSIRLFPHNSTTGELEKGTTIDTLRVLSACYHIAGSTEVVIVLVFT